MTNKVYKIDQNNIDFNIIENAANSIKSGALVSIPTETVYALVADFKNEAAVKKVYEAKKRDFNNPLTILVSKKSDFNILAKNISPQAKKVIDKFCPGAITLIFEKNEIAKDFVTSGKKNVAIRMPDNKIALNLIEESETFLVAPSANLSSRPSPTNAKHVFDDLADKVEMIIDAGESKFGLESTILDLSQKDEATILRLGAISFDEIKELLPNVLLDKSIFSEDSKQKHYSPKGKMLVIDSLDKTKVLKYILENVEESIYNSKKVGIISSKENFIEYKKVKELFVSELKYQNNTSNLYKLLRDFDDNEVELIFSESFFNENDSFLQVLNNRILIAANNEIVFLD